MAAEYETPYESHANLCSKPSVTASTTTGLMNLHSHICQTAYDNHMALIDFFEGFPEYKDNDFYVTGESYAGIYVPTLSVRLMNDPDFNFKVVLSFLFKQTLVLPL